MRLLPQPFPAFPGSTKTWDRVFLNLLLLFVGSFKVQIVKCQLLIWQNVPTGEERQGIEQRVVLIV
jgi:hypothetical protein